MKYRFCDQYRRLFLNHQTSNDGEQDAMLDRRMLLRAGAAAAGAAALAPTVSALAHAPQAGELAQPGFYRFKLGTIEVTVVSDGTVAFPAETLWGDRADDARDLLTSTFH